MGVEYTLYQKGKYIMKTTTKIENKNIIPMFFEIGRNSPDLEKLILSIDKINRCGINVATTDGRTYRLNDIVDIDFDDIIQFNRFPFKVIKLWMKTIESGIDRQTIDAYFGGLEIHPTPKCTDDIIRALGGIPGMEFHFKRIQLGLQPQQSTCWCCRNLDLKSDPRFPTCKRLEIEIDEKDAAIVAASYPDARVRDGHFVTSNIFAFPECDDINASALTDALDKVKGVFLKKTPNKNRGVEVTPTPFKRMDEIDID